MNTADLTPGPELLPQPCHVEVAGVPMCAYHESLSDRQTLVLHLMAQMREVNVHCQHRSTAEALRFVELLKGAGLDACAVPGPCPVMGREPRGLDD